MTDQLMPLSEKNFAEQRTKLLTRLEEIITPETTVAIVAKQGDEVLLTGLGSLFEMRSIMLGALIKLEEQIRFLEATQTDHSLH